MKKSELKEMILEIIKEEILNERFPTKAIDLNKLREADRFWKMKVGEGNRIAGTRWLNEKSEIGDVIFWLNTVAEAWERRIFSAQK